MWADGSGDRHPPKRWTAVFEMTEVRRAAWPRYEGPERIQSPVWMPPDADRAGDIVLVDRLHNFTTLFGGTDSLKNFWRNLATKK